ncbi:MAG: DUF2799 domain-containing protein [Bdellovibrionota bacterium]
MKWFGFLLIILNLFSCASYFKRKDCESTNWFNYGEQVALDGRRLSGDQFISECNQADADVAESDLDRGFKSGLQKYCQPEVVFQTGKNGRFFSTEMCVGQGLASLQVKHRAGVNEYCQRSNGYSAGAQGQAYNKICPVDLESSFLPEFNRGRKRYLAVVIQENNKSITQDESEISKLQFTVSLKRAELSRYQQRAKDEKTEALIMELNGQIRTLEYSIRSKQNKIDNLRSKNREIGLEVVQLER